MKILYASIICLFICLSAIGQSPPTLEGTKAYYLQKSNSANTTGWIMLGGGLAMTGAGIAIAVDNISLFEDNRGGEAGEIVLVFGGLGIALASIIPFSQATKYRRKAFSVAVGLQEIMSLSNYGYASSNNVPAVRLTVNLNGKGN